MSGPKDPRLDLKSMLQKYALEARGKPVPRESASDAEEEGKYLDLKRAAEEVQTLRLQNDQLKHNMEMRKTYAERLFSFVVAWTVFSWTIVVLQGFGVCHFSLADQPLTALLGTGIVSVLGLMLAILKGLFPSSEK